MNVKFLIDVLDMGFYGIVRNAQLFLNEDARSSASKKPEHFVFSSGQAKFLRSDGACVIEGGCGTLVFIRMDRTKGGVAFSDV